MTGIYMEPWRLRCPAGHCSVSPSGSGYYCESCRDHVDHVTDAKTGSRIHGRVQI